VGVAALVFVAAACGQTAAQAGTTYTVGVDGSTDEFNASFHRFFPNRLTVHPGDAIRFQRPENGEPHTVSFGTAIPQTESCPGCNFFESGFGSKPRLDASMRCFLAEGRPSFSDGCSSEQQEPIPFDGTESWFNSGGLLGSEEYVLELADDIAPGTYVFVCLLHTSNMKGTITVVEPDEAADDPADVVARGVEQLAADIGRMKSALEQQRIIDEGIVLAALEFDFARMWANTFTPEEIEVPVGGTVTWDIRGEHTIAFNAPESARPLYERADDGSVRQNGLAAETAGDASAWDGAGFLNSGLRAGLFPPARFSVTFTTPGTYTYMCLVHFDMEGKVKVGG
jgi:plastocyanin